MGLISLYAGLLLPWLGGAFWLVFAESKFAPHSSANRFRQAGYGFFLGYAVLFFAVLVSNRLFGSVSWPGLMIFLALFTISGALAARLSSASKSSAVTPRAADMSKTARALSALLLVWIAIHITLFAVDIFTQPLYPWDAWLAWVYRAKAWFLAGSISNVVSTAGWTAASTTGTYTIDAWMYPLLPSVVPYWAALSLGRWSEILVNVPVLFAGLAIGMALYGQCREYGLGVGASIICCYLLYSIPLLGTHLALAGYADIWMAGFTGLGFIAVIRASVTRSAGPGSGSGLQMGLGILMLVLAIVVKNEGAVWFLAALTLLLLVSCRARVPILIIVAMTLVALLGFALGITHVDIPFIGTLGMVDGRLVIPFIGNFVLEVHSIWQVYWQNFFTMGSWNLLWLLVLTAWLLSLKSTNDPAAKQLQRVGFTFFCIFLATQWFIFGLTDQGLWADTFTAINRLPLHFVPALLFTVFVLLHSRFAKGEIGDG